MRGRAWELQCHISVSCCVSYTVAAIPLRTTVGSSLVIALAGLLVCALAEGGVEAAGALAASKILCSQQLAL